MIFLRHVLKHVLQKPTRSMGAVMLDSSAVLAAILGEPGGDAVFDVLDEAAISTINVAEVYTYAAVNSFATSAIDAFFAETGIEIVPFAHDHAVLTGQLAAITKKTGLSLGDRACLAVAKSRQATVITADRGWANFASELGLSITLR